MVVTAVASLVLALLRTRRDQLRAEIALGQARAHASALQAQINPHFFFNALNTIAALIAIDPPAAQQVVDRLGEVSRRTLAAPTRDFVDLADEIELTRAYLDIEVVRFGERLRVDLPARSPAVGLQIPPLTMQPLVDNAIRHGIAARPNGGHLVVRADRSTRGWKLVVENDVDPVTLSTDVDFFQAGHALANIRDRLALIYGTRASIRVTRPRPDAVRVEFDVPDCP
jgi:two-component system sensor histidine kinase AlgZ